MATSFSSTVPFSKSHSIEPLPRNPAGLRLKISPQVSVELLYRDYEIKVPPRVDCTVMFAGAHLAEILVAYEEAVRLFSKTQDSAELLKHLNASQTVQKIYESKLVRGRAAIEMRERIFHEPGPVEQLEFRLRVLVGKRRLFYPVPLERFAALGALCPLLLGRHDEAAIERDLTARLSGDDVGWACELLAFLKRESCLAVASRADADAPSWAPRPGVTLLSHSSLLAQSQRSAVLIDPVVWRVMGNSERTFDILRTPLGAICCSHSHWDHCHFQTLMWLDKSLPVLIPAAGEPSMLNPPMAGALRRLGFTDVREVRPWEPVQIADIEIVPVPFRGEQDELGFEMDHYTYVIRMPGLSFYGGVDSYRSTAGDMRPVVEEVGRKYHPDVAFLPVSKWICYFKSGGVNAFCRYLDQKMLERSFQYTAGPRDAADWTVLLDARLAVPYATFTFTRAKLTPETVQFALELKKRGIGERFCPMAPLDSLTAADLGDSLRARSRRWRRVARSRALGEVYRVGQRAGLGSAFHFLRERLHG